MSNIIDYMKWRGDLTFAQDSFNEIDNLILSQLVYVELNNIVPRGRRTDDLSARRSQTVFQAE